MALAMAATIVAGFSRNLAMGRATFASPLLYHVHGVIFIGWIGLYLAQAYTTTAGRRAMAVFTGPALGRLMPGPLLIPYSWEMVITATLIFRAIAMIAGLRRRGKIHPAYWWGTGLYAGTFAVSMLLAYSPLGYAITEAAVAGTPGAERPMVAYLPPGFAM